MTFTQAVQTYWKINRIWLSNEGGITVSQALHQLSRAQRAVPLNNKLYLKIADLITDICNNAADPEELDTAAAL